MSTKLTISDAHPEFRIYQDVFENDKVFVKIEKFFASGGGLELTNGHLTLAISHDTFKNIVKEWETNKHLFETEFQDLVSSIEELLSDLEDTESPKPIKEPDDD